MTETLIALISIFVGIIGALLFGLLFKNKSNGFVGNILSGVFGSIFFMKSIGRLGVDPVSIFKSGSLNTYLFMGNILLSFVGGIIGVIVANKLRKLMSK